jgi:hypothetical protein
VWAVISPVRQRSTSASVAGSGPWNSTVSPGGARPVEEIAQQPGAGQVELCLPGGDLDLAAPANSMACRVRPRCRQKRSARHSPLSVTAELIRIAPRCQVHARSSKGFQARVLCVPSHSGALAECLQAQK